jgi:hypothetical protein
MTIDTNEQAKVKEEWLREELRAVRTRMLGLLQWGVTVLAAAELNLYYIRRDATKHLVEQRVLQPNELLPFLRWFTGTLLLIILACVFSTYMRRQVHRLIAYRKQLLGMNPSYSGIVEDLPTGGTISRLHYLLFFIFPCFDLFVWLMFFAGKKFQINIPW